MEQIDLLRVQRTHEEVEEQTAPPRRCSTSCLHVVRFTFFEGSGYAHHDGWIVCILDVRDRVHAPRQETEKVNKRASTERVKNDNSGAAILCENSVTGLLPDC
eukprot:5102078-Pleurochrysis_carterae.AAC.7